MGFGLEAPVAVPVEVRAPDQRVYRLCESVAVEGLRLERPAPFEIGREVSVRFALPDGEAPLVLRAHVETTGEAAEEDGERGGCGLRFFQVTEGPRAILTRYVLSRLGLPHI